jgi:exopolyphosphatase / guanosine-5'-triphosphate,3'-diphosphate pyrophosphatase
MSAMSPQTKSNAKFNNNHPPVQSHPLLAAVDLGSNSFRLQIARVEGDQLYMQDGMRESVRLAAGLTADNYLDAAAQQRALTALARFAERLRGMPIEAVRAVGTNSLRVAINAAEFIPQAEKTLGFPIEVIAGREEARLIYQGVAHGLPPSSNSRLVIDIGGGSTEFILGRGFTPSSLESLYMGCVSFSARFFASGKITKAALNAAELAARSELQPISAAYRGQWQEAWGSSGTAKMLCEILEQNRYSDSGITRAGLEKLRGHILKVGDVQKLNLLGLKADRLAAFAGGFAIMYAAFCELEIKQMQPALGALREGVLHDLWGRAHNADMRDITVKNFMRRYQVDAKQAQRVEPLARLFAEQFLGDDEQASSLQLLSWIARLHEIGIRIAHNGYHKHSAYILAHADMPGFSKKEQTRMSVIVLAQRGRLDKLKDELRSEQDCLLAMSLRLATLFYRNRSAITPPNIRAHFTKTRFNISLDASWLSANPLVQTALHEEAKQWTSLGLSLQITTHTE